jgi:nucleotide-binding universal stress UspA family protein
MKTILVPLDFSTCARGAARYAIRLAAQTGDKLVFFHSTFLEIPTRSSKEAYQQAVRREIEKQTARLDKEVNGLYRAAALPRDAKGDDLLVKFGLSFKDNVFEAAQETKAQLIVMGTQGASGLSKMLFGSNTAGLIAASPVPVLAVPTGQRFHPIRKLIYTTDLSDIGRELPVLFPWANAVGASIEAVHFDYGWNHPDNPQARFDEVAGRPGAPVCRLQMLKADIDQSLEENLRRYLDKQRGFVLASFTSDRDFFEKILLGSLTRDLAHKLNFPLLSVRKATL